MLVSELLRMENFKKGKLKKKTFGKKNQLLNEDNKISQTIPSALTKLSISLWWNFRKIFQEVLELFFSSKKIQNLINKLIPLQELSLFLIKFHAIKSLQLLVMQGNNIFLFLKSSTPLSFPWSYRRHSSWFYCS